jgi:hypothetical protein
MPLRRMLYESWLARSFLVASSRRRDSRRLCSVYIVVRYGAFMSKQGSDTNIALRLFFKQSPIVLLVYSKQYIMSKRVVLMMVTLTACVVQVSVSCKYYCCYRMLQKQVYYPAASIRSFMMLCRYPYMLFDCLISLAVDQ